LLSFLRGIHCLLVQLGLELRSDGWMALNELQRFALVKLSHPGHEHRNLPQALAEFGLLIKPT